MEKLKVLIGRSSQCDYTIENPEQHGTVSGKHATILEADAPNTFLFEDHSTNGSYVNGKLVHHSSCMVTVSDYITLGKTYTLPLADITKRYFTSSKTTKKAPSKSTEDTFTPIVEEPAHSDNATCLLSNEEVDKTPSVVTVEKIVEKEKVPIWFWVLYGVSVFIALTIGVIAGICVANF